MMDRTEYKCVIKTHTRHTGTVKPMCNTPELTMGQWVMGQMGQQIWMAHMGHVSVSVTH